MSTESTVEEKDEARDAAEGAHGDDEEDNDSEDSEDEKVSVAPPKDKVVIDRPSGASMIWTIAKRELGSYFHSPITYIVGSVSFLVFGLWFFYYKGGFWQVDRASMARMFDMVPYALCLVIPLYTMRSLSDEKRVGTIELLITMPVKDSEVILGKYLAAFLMVTLQIALLAIYPLAMFKWPWHIGELDMNAYWVGMLGLVLLAAAGTAIGLMWSSFTESQILSFFAGALTLGALYAMGLLTLLESARGWIGDAIAFVSLQTRFESFARGIIDSRAIIYFLSLTVLALLVSFRMLERRKWA